MLKHNVYWSASFTHPQFSFFPFGFCSWEVWVWTKVLCYTTKRQLWILRVLEVLCGLVPGRWIKLGKLYSAYAYAIIVLCFNMDTPVENYYRYWLSQLCCPHIDQSYLLQYYYISFHPLRQECVLYWNKIPLSCLYDIRVLDMYSQACTFMSLIFYFQ